MAQLAMGAVGAAIGGMIGGPTGARIGWAIGTYLGQEMFGPEAANTEGPRLSELMVTSSAYGTIIPIIYGTARASGNIIWSAGIKETKHTEEQDGKGGSGPTHTSYSYSCSFALGLAEGEATQLLRIWADGKLIYDTSDPRSIAATKFDIATETSDILNFRFYTGSETQTPDGLIMSHEGTDISAHRGLCYVVFEDMPLANYGNRIPNITCEVAFTPVDITYPTTFKTLPHEELDIGSDTELTDTFRGWLVFSDDTNDLFIYDYAHLWKLNADDLSIKLHIDLTDIITPLPGESAVYWDSMRLVESEGKLLLWHEDTNASKAEALEVDPLTLEVTSIFVHTYTTVRETATSSKGILRWRPARPSLTQGITYNWFGNTNTGSVDLRQYGDAWIGPPYPDTVEDARSGAVPMDTGHMIMVSPVARRFVDRMEYDIAIYVINPNLGYVTYPNLVNIDSIVPQDLLDDTSDSSLLGVQIYQHYRVRYCEYDHSIIVDFEFQLFNPVRKLVKFFLPDNIRTDNATLPTLDWAIALDTIDLRNVSDYFFWGLDNTGTREFSFYHPIITSDYFFHDFFEVTSGVRHDTLGNINLDTGAVTQDLADWSGLSYGSNITSALQVFRLDKFSVYGHMYSDTTGLFWYKVDPNVTVIPEEELLTNIVEDICSRVDLVPVTDIDVTELSGITVPGYVLSSQSAARAPLEQLAVAYLFDIVESDYVLATRLRGRTPVATLSEDEFTILDANMGTIIKETRTQEVELPVDLRINYKDLDNDYQPNVQRATRSQQPIPTMESVHTITIELPIVEHATFMKQLAQKILYAMWLNRVNYESTTSWRWLKLDPTDVIFITLIDGTTFQARIVEMQYGGDMLIPMSLISDDAVLYTADVAGDGGLGVPSQSITRRGKSTLFMLDVPLLRDVDSLSREKLRIYYAVAATTDGWPGATLYTSSDDINYNVLGQAVNSVPWGTIQNSLPNTDTPFLTDEDTQLTVYMQFGGDTLASVTKDQILTDSENAAAVIKNNAAGEVEIIQFQNVTDNGDGTYTLDTLYRGRRGTDAFVNSHNTGEKIIFLSTTVVQSKEAALSQHNVSKYYRAVTYGTLLDNADTEEFAPSGRDLMPWAPVHETATENAGDIDITWVRRTRINGYLRDGTDEVPLNEDSEEYELEIYDSPGGTLLRTYTGITSPSYTYPNADITTDFGSVPSNLTIKVYQISAQVGRGFSDETTIPVE